MKPAIEIIGVNRCTGCYACYSSCPVHAIIMDLDEKGFLIPFVDFCKCTNCGLCQQYCPIITSLSENDSNPVSFAAWTKDEKVQLQSSSGGVFSELAKSIINTGGAVFGASFDKCFTLMHCCVENQEDVAILRGSKYVQSHINNIYTEAISIAMKDRPVLFCGTPCQIAALNNFVCKNNSYFGELYSCEVICHGVPSESVFKAYLSNISDQANSKVIEFSFRDKRISWDNYGIRASFLNGTEYFKIHEKDTFMVGYLRNIYLRSICYDCPFAKLPRKSDITLGDFWGVPKNLYNPRGVSVVIINNSQGRQLFDRLTGIHKFPVSIEQISHRNPRLINGHYEKPSERADFFRYFKDMGYQKASEKYLKRKFKKNK